MADLSKIKPVLTNQLEVGYKYYSRTFDIAVIPFLLNAEESVIYGCLF